MRSKDGAVLYAKSCSLKAEKDRCTLKQLRFHVNQHLERKKQECTSNGFLDTCILTPLANLTLVGFVFRVMIRLISLLLIVPGER